MGPRPSPIVSELEKETQKYQEAHSMASESNLTLNKVSFNVTIKLKIKTNNDDDYIKF